MLTNEQKNQLIQGMVDFSLRVMQGTADPQEMATLPKVLDILFRGEDLSQ